MGPTQHEKMKIGIVTTWFERGASVVSRQIVDALQDSADVFVYARGEKYAKGDPKWDLPYVHWATRLHWPGSGKIDKIDFTDWIALNEIDTLIFNEQRWWEPIIWAKELGVKTGAYIDYYTEETIENFAVYDFLICNTLRHFSAFKWHSGARYVPWGTQLDLFKPTPKPNETFTFFLSCGWDGYRKGLDLAIKAFDQIKSGIDAELLIHTQADVSGFIQCPQKIKTIQKTIPAPGLYALGDVYVYPSRLEGIGLTVCEALACGLPVITTDEPPMLEFVIDEYNGFLVPVKRRFKRSDGYYWRMSEVSPKRLSEIMLKAYNMDRSELAAMKVAARTYSEEERDWDRNAREIYNVISQCRFTPITLGQKKRLFSYDLQGPKGKLDYLLLFKPTRYAVSMVTEVYRKFRQPHLYR